MRTVLYVAAVILGGVWSARALLGFIEPNNFYYADRDDNDGDSLAAAVASSRLTGEIVTIVGTPSEVGE